MIEEEPQEISKDIMKAPLSEARINTLKKARDAKKVKKEIKEIESARYTDELKNIHLHIANLTTKMNTMVTAITSLESNSGIKRQLKSKKEIEEIEEEDPDETSSKKQKTGEVKGIPTVPSLDPAIKGPESKYSVWLGQAFGAALSLGTLYYFKSTNSGGNPAHIKYNFL